MKTKLLFPLLAIMLFVAACGGTSNKTNDVTTPFIGGNVGVKLGLVDSMPPAMVYDNKRQDFSIGVALQNVGEADIGPGTANPYAQVSIGGFLPDVFGLTNARMTQALSMPLLGSHKLSDGSILPGQVNRVIFSPLNYQGRLQGATVVKFLINFCYDYENLATVPICFKNDVIETTQDEQVCTLSGEKSPQNSGGPIQVTSLLQNPLAPDKEMIDFVVEHVGTGDFYGRTADETCDPSITNTNKYNVGVAVTSDDAALQIVCSELGGTANGTITLYQGAPMTVTCTLTGNNVTQVYTDLLTIHLTYRYGESMIQPVTIATGNNI